MNVTRHELLGLIEDAALRPGPGGINPRYEKPGSAYNRLPEADKAKLRQLTSEHVIDVRVQDWFR